MSQTNLIFNQPIVTQFENLLQGRMDNLIVLPIPCQYKMPLIEKLLDYPRWLLLEARTDEKILFVTFGLLVIVVLLMLLFPEKEPIRINFSDPEQAMSYLDTLNEGTPEYLEAECQIKNEVARLERAARHNNINN